MLVRTSQRSWLPHVRTVGPRRQPRPVALSVIHFLLTVSSVWLVGLVRIIQYKRATFDSDNIKMEDSEKKREKREETDVKRFTQTSEPTRSPVNTDESLPSLNKIRFDDNIVVVGDSKKPSKSNEKWNKERKTFSDSEKSFHIERIRAQESEATRSSTDTDESLPSLNKVRFDDNIVAVADPEKSLSSTAKTDEKRNAFSSDKKSFQKERNRDGIATPPESTVTVQTFTTPSEKYALPSSSRGDQPKKVKDKTNEIEGKERERKVETISRDGETRMEIAKDSNTSTRENLNERRSAI
ncbi:hypothetical protein KIN20_033262 [Parelaphostrongylus tenuis]|uniref:Uncharacterized protein n=1 Tax=Parelaphostrongylus tenuis TaxID=148309 RepID=A0AAD5R854_PARTN|nr:hypothetical protein KIN20_033262 [Parelaphostrongylus tenuis]